MKRNNIHDLRWLFYSIHTTYQLRPCKMCCYFWAIKDLASEDRAQGGAVKMYTVPTKIQSLARGYLPVGGGRIIQFRQSTSRSPGPKNWETWSFLWNLEFFLGNLDFCLGNLEFSRKLGVFAETWSFRGNLEFSRKLEVISETWSFAANSPNSCFHLVFKGWPENCFTQNWFEWFHKIPEGH